MHIETGPHKHAIQGTFFLYVWEPAGNRVELANAGARLILQPDWETVTWTEADTGWSAIAATLDEIGYPAAEG